MPLLVNSMTDIKGFQANEANSYYKFKFKFKFNLGKKVATCSFPPCLTVLVIGMGKGFSVLGLWIVIIIPSNLVDSFHISDWSILYLMHAQCSSRALLNAVTDFAFTTSDGRLFQSLMTRCEKR